MKITDLQKAVREIDFNDEKQEELLRALQAESGAADGQAFCGSQLP